MVDLIGRAGELAAVRTELARPGGAVVVYGEAGAGKTALATAALTSTPHLTGGALATLSWSAHLALRRALGDQIPEADWRGDVEHIASTIGRTVGDQVLFLEDLHWADTASIQVITMLAGSTRILATVRRGDTAATTTLQALCDAGLSRVDVDPLEHEDAAALVRRLGPGLPHERVESVIDRSGGNPLLAEELVRAGKDATSLRLALAARVRPLPEEALEGLALLAVAGRELPATAVPGLDQLLEAGLVRPVADHVAVRHSLIGEVVAEMLSDERAVRCHHALAVLLTHPGDRARHHLAAGDTDEAYAEAMRAVLTATTPGEKAQQLAIAATCVSGPEGAVLRLQAAQAAVDGMDPSTAAALVDDIPDLPALRTRIELMRGQIAYDLGDYEGWRDRTESAAAAVEPGAPEEIRVLAEQASIPLFLDGDAAVALPLARHALAEAERRSAPVAFAANIVGCALWLTFEPEAFGHLERALVAARAEGDLQVERSAANNVISSNEAYGDPDRGRTLAREMVQRADALRLTGWRNHFEYSELNLAMHAGDYEAVLARAPQVLARATFRNTRQELSVALAVVQALTGRSREAVATCQAHIDGDDGRAASQLHFALATTHLLAGNARLGYAELAAFTAAGPDPHTESMAAPTFGWAALEAGSDAPDAPDLFVEHGMLGGVESELAGIAALRAGHPDRAAAHFGAAAAKYQRYDHLRALWSTWARGEALRLDGRASVAKTVLTEVEADAESHAMAPMVARARQSLRALGVRRSGQSTVRSGALTERERAVVALIGRGLSNREIASRLGVSPRTVDTQVESARRKLGAANRNQLADLAQRSQDQPPAG